MEHIYNTVQRSNSLIDHNNNLTDNSEKSSIYFNENASTSKISNTIEVALSSTMMRVRPEKFNEILDLDGISFE